MFLNSGEKDTPNISFNKKAYLKAAGLYEDMKWKKKDRKERKKRDAEEELRRAE